VYCSSWVDAHNPMEPQVEGPPLGHQQQPANDNHKHNHKDLSLLSPLNTANLTDRTRTRSNTATPTDRSPTTLREAGHEHNTDLVQRSYSVAHGDRRRKSSDKLANGGARERRGETRPEGQVRRPSEVRYCGKCDGRLTGQFVRALEDTFHLECFTCRVRGFKSLAFALD